MEWDHGELWTHKPWKDSPEGVWSLDPLLLGRFSSRVGSSTPGITAVHADSPTAASLVVAVTHPESFVSPVQLYLAVRTEIVEVNIRTPERWSNSTSKEETLSAEDA